jgi:hypothetical protein
VHFEAWRQPKEEQPKVVSLLVWSINRKNRRREEVCEGWVTLANSQVFPCSIRTLKEAGFELRLPGSHPPLTDQFRMSFSGLGLSFPVRLISRSGSIYGVEIEGDARILSKR